MYDLFTAALVLRGFQAAKMARGDVRRRMIKVAVGCEVNVCV